MATLEQFMTALGRIDAATNNLAVQLQQLKDKVAQGGVTPENEDWILGQLDAAIVKLQGMGTTSADTSSETGGINTGEETPAADAITPNTENQ